MRKTNQGQKGIGLIEVMVVISIIIITFWTFLELVRFSLIIQERNKAKLEAANLATEAVEAARSLRDEDWNNFASLTPGTKYYPVVSGNKWTLNIIDPGPINGLYDRWIILEEVYRDASDNINSSGALDSETKKVTAYTEWTSRGDIQQINITTYLTNWPN